MCRDIEEKFYQSILVKSQDQVIRNFNFFILISLQFYLVCKLKEVNELLNEVKLEIVWEDQEQGYFF